MAILTYSLSCDFEILLIILTDNMSAVNFLYNKVLKRTSTFALAIIGGVFIFERVFDQGADYLFEYINRGVST